MGISGLLPFLKKSSVNTNVREFSGCTVAVDAYCWLHKGAFSCADKLVKGEKTDAYVTYCMKLVNMLLSHNVRPIMVFDGKDLPSKLVTEVKRRENRERNKLQAREYLRQGNTAKARECFQRCVDVTSVMAHQLMKACRARSVNCIVAPYEADAQLAFLALNGIAHIVITEDSDLLAFGCPRVFFKMDHTGSGVLIEKDRIPLSLGGRAEYFNSERFRRMCILSGCDYLPSLPGIGLGKAFKFFSRTTNDDINLMLCQIPSCLNMSKLEVTTEYRCAFIQADQTFLYQLVYDPTNRKLTPLNPYPAGVDPASMPYAGSYLDDETAFQMAIGNLDVQTMDRLDSYDPDQAAMQWDRSLQTTNRRCSIWSRNSGVAKSSGTELAAEALPAKQLSKQLSARVNFAMRDPAAEAPPPPPEMSDSELAGQYLSTGSGACTSPVLHCGRKRKRPDENDTPTAGVQNLTPLWTPKAAVAPLSTTNNSDRSKSPAEAAAVCTPSRTTGRPANPFVKIKSPDGGSSPSAAVTARFSALTTFSQLRTTTPEGEEIVTSSYFSKVDCTTDSGGSDPQSTAAAPCGAASARKLPPAGLFGQPAPVAGGCRVSGLKRSTPAASKRPAKTSSASSASSGMRQLNLLQMFGQK